MTYFFLSCLLTSGSRSLSSSSLLFCIFQRQVIGWLVSNEWDKYGGTLFCPKFT